MGYSTEFTGEMKFKTELSASQLAKVKSFLDEDIREHPEWQGSVVPNDAWIYYIKLEFLDDFSGLRWSGVEKTNGLHAMLNLITLEMRKEYPDFCLEGSMMAQGEDVEDRWQIIIDDTGMAQKIDIVIMGSRVTCPHCEQEFILEGQEVQEIEA